MSLAFQTFPCSFLGWVPSLLSELNLSTYKYSHRGDWSIMALELLIISQSLILSTSGPWIMNSLQGKKACSYHGLFELPGMFSAWVIYQATFDFHLMRGLAEAVSWSSLRAGFGKLLVIGGLSTLGEPCRILFCSLSMGVGRWGDFSKKPLILMCVWQRASDH